MKNVFRLNTPLTKRLAVCICLMLVIFNLSAEPVSLQQAQSLASRFFAQQMASSKHGVKGQEVEVVPIRLDATQRHRIAPHQGAQTQAPFYIFNRADGQGFVIVSGESETVEVLAYSLDDVFHPEALGQGAESFLQFYAGEIDRIRQGQALAQSHYARKTGTRVLLKTINLNQNAIYLNAKYAPTYQGRLCLAGCGPVAMATVMAYHKWPVVAGVGSESYTTETNKLKLSMDFEAEEPIDWTLIKSGITTSGKASDECSRLLLQCGVAMHTDYDPSFTNSMLSGLVCALRQVFHYDACTTVMRDCIPTVDEWDDIMLGELDDHERPVIVCAQGSINNWDRHIFVVDGHDANGLYHYNLGWGGQNNGYYVDGKISTSNLYWCDGIVYGIQPLPEEDGRLTSACLAFKNISLTSFAQDEEGQWNPEPLDRNLQTGANFDVTIFGLQNCYYKTLNGHLRAELHSADGKLKRTISNNVEINGLLSGYFYYWFYLRCNIPATVKPLPTDYVSISFRWSNTSQWIPLYSIDNATSYVPANREVALPLLSPTAADATGSASRGYFDLQGRQLPAAPSQGIYIRNGRKIIPVR